MLLNFTPFIYALGRRLAVFAVGIAGVLALPAAGHAQGSLSPQYNNVPDCGQPQRYDFVIGDPARPTVYTGQNTFVAGDYHVVGDLYFKDGVTTIQTGARFHVEGKIVTSSKRITQVVGYSITLGANATINAEGAVFDAACNRSMWKGFAFDPDQKHESLTLRGCGVANALRGLSVSPYCTDAYYYLDGTRFEANQQHILDNSYHFTSTNTPISTINNCEFYSQHSLLPPYRSATGLDSWTYEALHLTPTGNNDGQPKIVLKGSNHITGAIYGLIANEPGQALVYQDGGRLDIERVVRVGIWLDVMKHAIRLPYVVSIGMNDTPAGRNYRTTATGAAEQRYGMVVANNTGYFTNYELSVRGPGGDTAQYRSQTGAMFDEIHEDLNYMTLSGLTYGLSLRAGQGGITANTFDNCLHGLRIRPNTGPYSSSFDISCNSFIASAYASSSGIYIDPQATLNDQGSLSYPVGNRFQGFAGGDRAVVNNGLRDMNYYRYDNSVDEEIASIRNSPAFGSQSKGRVISTTNPSYTLNDYCRNLRVASTGVQMRGASRATLMRALMDTLRQRTAPAARLGRYQVAIREWLLRDEPDTLALDAYVRTLALANRPAFYGLGLDLLEQYRRTGRTALAAGLRPLLAAGIAAFPAANDRLALSDVLSRLGKTNSLPVAGRAGITAADSLTLRRLARTPGGTAETAALWFNYLCPGASIQAAMTRPVAEAVATDVRLYPNPATEQLHIELATPAVGEAVIRLTNLLSGQVVAQTALRGPAAMLAADLNLRGVPTGQYAATLLVNGVPVRTQKVLVSH